MEVSSMYDKVMQFVFEAVLSSELQINRLEKQCDRTDIGIGTDLSKVCVHFLQDGYHDTKGVSELMMRIAEVSESISKTKSSPVLECLAVVCGNLGYHLHSTAALELGNCRGLLLAGLAGGDTGIHMPHCPGVGQAFVSVLESLAAELEGASFTSPEEVVSVLARAAERGARDRPGAVQQAAATALRAALEALRVCITHTSPANHMIHGGDIVVLD